MCGPIVLTYSLSTPKGGALRAHLLYNAGRIATYIFLGALAGAAGGAIGVLVAWRDWLPERASSRARP